MPNEDDVSNLENEEMLGATLTQTVDTAKSDDVPVKSETVSSTPEETVQTERTMTDTQVSSAKQVNFYLRMKQFSNAHE